MQFNTRGTSESIASDSVFSGASTNASSSSRYNESSVFESEQPSFEVEPVQLQFDLQNSLRHLQVQNNIMYLISQTNTVFKIDLDNPSNVSQYSVPTPSSDSNQVTDSWLHPNGLHLIIEINHKYYYYLHHSYRNFKVISRFKNLHIKYITFPYDSEFSSYENTTGDFLVATTEGTVYLALLKVHDPLTQENKRDDKYVKQVYKHTASSSASQTRIAGLTFSNNIQIHLIINNQLLTWDCFDTSYSELTKVFKVPPRITALPPSSSTLPSSSSAKSNASSPPSHAATKTLFESNVQTFTYIVPSTKEIYSNDPEVQLSQSEKLNTGNLNLPTSKNSFVASRHHLILLNSSRDTLIIINKLSSDNYTLIDLQNKLGSDEQVLGIVVDHNASTYWLYTNNNIYELIISNESVSVWFNYYKMGRYEEALKCLEDQEVSNPFKKDMVLVKQGYEYLQNGGFGIDYSNDEIDDDLLSFQIEGIKVLAQSSEPFEKICLMLLNLQQSLSSKPKSSPSHISETLLIEYLMVKFNIATKVDKNKIRMTVLSSWIVELMLRVLYNLETELGNMKSAGSVVTVNGNGQNQDQLHNKTKSYSNKKSLFDNLEKQLNSFLKKNFKVLDSKTIYQIMQELNYPTRLIAFAELIEDYELILNYYIDVGHWEQALSTLFKIYKSNSESSEEIIYHNSMVLLVNHPRLTVETWLRFPVLDYTRLLPAILTFNKNNRSIPLTENHTLQFLSKIIYDKGVRNESINNYYFSLLISYPVSSSSPAEQTTRHIIKMLSHMKNESVNVSKRNQLYDPDFILRLCLRYEQYHPAILILINDMSLFEQALKLALAHELTDLAELVLRRYDEHMLKESNMDEHGDYEVVYKNTDAEEDIGYVGKIKLEEKSFTSRKKLWMLFAKYLIDGVCEGKSFGILDNVEDDQYVDGDKRGDFSELPNQGPDEEEKSSIKDITNNLLQSMTSKSETDDKKILKQNNHSKLSKVLKYLLNTSYSSNRFSNVLSLKDLLPLFPESIMINNFKDEIVHSLNQYNNRISQLTLEMQESSNIASHLKEQIKQSSYNNNKGKVYTIIEPGESCRLCHKLLLNKNFVCFTNCHHNYHKECLIRFYLKSKGDYRFKKVFQDFKKNSSVSNKKELDDIMLKDCVLCNESNINALDSNIIDFSKERDEISEWIL